LVLASVGVFHGVYVGMYESSGADVYIKAKERLERKARGYI
jgi:hypothetical protein